MQGTITFFDKDNLKGSIQADDGRMVAFDKSSLASDQDLNQLQIDLRVELELASLRPAQTKLFLKITSFINAQVKLVCLKILQRALSLSIAPLKK